MRALQNRVGRLVLCLALAMLCAACATSPHKSASADASTRAVIGGYFDALNRRDLLVLTAYVTPDFQWLSIVDGERIVEVESREALVETLRKHFEQYEIFRWNVVDARVLDDQVAVTERSEWREGGAPQQRETLGVFELRDGRIRRVTYFLTQ